MTYRRTPRRQIMIHEVDARAAGRAVVEGRVALLHKARNLGLLVDTESEGPRSEDVERDRLAEERERNDMVQEEDEVLKGKANAAAGAMEVRTCCTKSRSGDHREPDVQARPCRT